jgi:hypothetical protein
MAKLMTADITVAISGINASCAWRGVSMGDVSEGGAHRLGAATGTDKPEFEG